MVKVYIDENINIKTNSEAEAAFAKQSDIGFLTNDGVIKISEDRWRLAQIAEAKHWMELGKGANSDRNAEHASDFNDYNVLKNHNFSHAVEFGCGPFTNLRVIGNVTNIEKCTLIDPLANQYLNHKNCAYKDNHHLNCGSKKIPADVLSIPGEMAPELHADLVVCINVLEHCYDAESFLKSFGIHVRTMDILFSMIRCLLMIRQRRVSRMYMMQPILLELEKE